MSLQSDVTDLKVAVAEMRVGTESMNKKLDKVVSAIDGNGKPGLTTRVDRLEQSSRLRGKVIWLVVAAIISACVSVAFAGF
jgi:hypothetical protein